MHGEKTGKARGAVRVGVMEKTPGHPRRNARDASLETGCDHEPRKEPLTRSPPARARRQVTRTMQTEHWAVEFESLDRCTGMP